MKRVIAMSALAFAATVGPVFAQSTATSPQSRPLAEVAKDEEARRKSVRKPSKVFTNSDLRQDTTAPAVAPVATPATPPAGNASPAKPAADAPPARDQAYWSGRMVTLRNNLQRSQMFLDALQSRINALQTEYVNRDDPAQRAKIETDRNAALAEFEKVKKEVADHQKAIADLEEEARRAGVPPGWLRPA